MVGAKKAALDEVRPLLLSTIAKDVYHMGDEPGQGQLMKLLNNFLVATALAATSEAMVVGVREGMDLARMIDVINSCGTGRNTATVDKFPKSVIPGTYDYGFAAALMNKDVALYLEGVETLGVPHDVSTAVARVWQGFTNSFPDKDFTYIYKYLKDLQEHQ
jgi:3-hydroxyisobutyrate dehydrogenase-like beta-hydroxyacid dehydrogenase